jgi:hypothetical protein
MTDLPPKRSRASLKGTDNLISYPSTVDDTSCTCNKVCNITNENAWDECQRARKTVPFSSTQLNNQIVVSSGHTVQLRKAYSFSIQGFMHAAIAAN